MSKILNSSFFAQDLCETLFALASKHQSVTRVKEQDSIHVIRHHPKWHVITYVYQHLGHSRAATAELGMQDFSCQWVCSTFVLLSRCLLQTHLRKKKKKEKSMFMSPTVVGYWSCTNRRAREITFVLDYFVLDR